MARCGPSLPYIHALNALGAVLRLKNSKQLWIEDRLRCLPRLGGVGRLWRQESRGRNYVEHTDSSERNKHKAPSGILPQAGSQKQTTAWRQAFLIPCAQALTRPYCFRFFFSSLDACFQVI